MRNLLIILLLCFSTSPVWSKNKLWTCINEKGQTVFTIEAIRVYEFQNGLARVYKNTLVNNAWVTGYGFINKKGEVVIPCDLDKAYDFLGDYIWVKMANQDYFTLIDKKGTIIPTKQYKKVGKFYKSQNEICAVYENAKMGFIDQTGKEIVPCKYLGSSYFSNGLVCLTLYDGTEEKYGFMNKNGKFVIPMKYKQAGTSSFYNGRARVKVDGKTVLIDTTGKVVFKTLHGNIQGVYNNLVCTFKGKNRTGWGWVNFKDEVVIPQIYDHAVNFNDDGLAIVELNDLVGVIDTTGKVVIPLKYKTIYCDITKDGFIMCVLPSTTNESLMNAKKDYFNANFEPINTSKYQYVMHANHSVYMPFKQNDKWGFLNKSFEIIIPAQYKKVKKFTEGLAFVLN